MTHHFQLLLQMARRDVEARYRGTAMGVLWSLVTPLAMLIVYTFVFSEVFGARWSTSTDDKVGFAINLFAGLIVHGLFAECASRATGMILQHSSYVKKVVFPLWLLGPVILGSALFHACISFLVLFAAFVFFYGFLHWQIVLLPFVLAPFLVMLLGVVWLLSAAGVFLRDIGQLMPVVITAMLFMAPVFYPVSALPEGYRDWLYLNPLTPAIEMARDLIISGEIPDLASYVKYLAMCLAVAVGGYAFFIRLKKGFADVI